MLYYVYVIQSEVDGSFYKGFTTNPVQRLGQYNNELTPSTKNLCPWRMVHLESWSSKAEALKREKNLKKATRERIINLINHPKNIVRQIINH